MKDTLKEAKLDTPLGPMVMIANTESLFLLEFAERRGLEKEIENLRKKIDAVIVPGKNKIINQITNELNQYFSGKSMRFKTPLHLLGTPFQKRVWAALQRIPLGQTQSYLDVAKTIQHPKAVRAVARANGANSLALIIPCHRVICSSGELGGYGGGVSRKKWLLQHEQGMEKH